MKAEEQQNQNEQLRQTPVISRAYIESVIWEGFANGISPMELTAELKLKFIEAFADEGAPIELQIDAIEKDLAIGNYTAENLRESIIEQCLSMSFLMQFVAHGL